VPCVSNAEFRELPAHRLPAHDRATDAREARSTLELAQERVDAVTRPFGDHADTPVGEIHGVPHDPEPIGAPHAEIPEANPLHPPVHEYLCRDAFITHRVG
jgi:hypothetical protein